MSRRVSLPTADDLFRPTADRSRAAADKAEPQSSGAGSSGAAVQPTEVPVGVPVEPTPGVKQPRKPSGRIRHDEKMTVYVTSDELLDIEHARLTLRRTTGMAVDRGRLVRSAIAIALADLEQNGDDSVLVSRLRES